MEADVSTPLDNEEPNSEDRPERRDSLNFDEASDEDLHGTAAGDYSQRMDAILSDEEDEDGEGKNTLKNSGVDSDDDDSDVFIYDGEAAEKTETSYRAQMRDVLESEEEDGEDQETKEEQEVEKVLTPPPHQLAHSPEMNGHKLVLTAAESVRSSTPSEPLPENSVFLTPPRLMSPSPSGTPRIRPFLHPSISRLRSVTPTPSNLPVSASIGTQQSHPQEAFTRSGSHLSALSRSSSLSNLRDAAGTSRPLNGHSSAEREVFRWTELRSLGEHVYSNRSYKANSVLGAPSCGAPMAIAANGLICIGTDMGRIMVFDFKQALICVCGNDETAKTVGPVTAVALSNDHTFVASGHAYGHIQLYDLKRPQTPARVVTPTSLSAVASGRQEGHLLGSRIVNIAFVAGRHTAVVTADDVGLSFYHSLGKVLFVEASDVLRILGKYPDEDPPSPPPHLSDKLKSGPHLNGNGWTPAPAPSHLGPRKTRKRNTILSMSPLPLGTVPHPTDAYHVIALLTPVKLVIVGLKPSPKTWFRRHRENEDNVRPSSKWKGVLAWYPSVVPPEPGKPEEEEKADAKKKKKGKEEPKEGSVPLLVYSWGSSLFLVRVSELKEVLIVKNARTGKDEQHEVGKLAFDDLASWSATGDVLALQWLNVHQVLVLTISSLEVYDVRTTKQVERVGFNSSLLISPSLRFTMNGSMSYHDSISEVAHSVRTYKGKIFMLERSEMRVGTLLSWADRILSFVADGEFINAIDLARLYYTGEAIGNKNGLPDDPALLKVVVGQKIRDLMTASARYAFSEDRLTDSTHVTSDGRGVDRTSLFEDLVTVCARACIALDDFDFLFEELFQWYDDTLISSIYLEHLEPFILDNSIRSVPPRITQRLIAMHDERARPDLVERVIWHIDPECLDVNQAVSLCQAHQLYDALIYVYTRAMRDYVSPVVELLALARQVQQYRRELRKRASASNLSVSPAQDDEAIESIAINAYKIFPYLANVLSGLTYPSEEPIPREEAPPAKEAIYTFLFHGRSKVWPEDGGKLVLTADEDNGIEPTYPYLRLLLRFDSESFLHSLDIAFEDPYFIEAGTITRLIVVKILLELSTAAELTSADVAFLRIFVARNVPKYPQDLHLPPSDLQKLLVGLATDSEPSTREDRQLATEYLLSTYTPHEGDQFIELFEQAGFYRILRSWHLREQQWAPLVLVYINDPDLRAHDIFISITGVLESAVRTNKDELPLEVRLTVLDSLPLFLDFSIPNTALMMDKFLPELHGDAMDAIPEDDDRKQFAYLRCLLGPPPLEDETMQVLRRDGPSQHVEMELREQYISLQCRLEPSGVVDALAYLPADFMEWKQVVSICEEQRVYHAAIWALDRSGDPRSALERAEVFNQRLSATIADSIVADASESDDQLVLDELREMGRNCARICLERSAHASDFAPEDMWFHLLKFQIECVQRISAIYSASSIQGAPPDNKQGGGRVLDDLRAIVQDTFGSLLSISGQRLLAFPVLFKRLVESTSQSNSSTGASWTEFQTILTGMLESYRSEGDILVITKHMVDRDLFDAIEDLSRERVKGWTPTQSGCAICRKRLTATSEEGEETPKSTGVIVSRTGRMYHTHCLPGGIPPSS